MKEFDVVFKSTLDTEILGIEVVMSTLDILVECSFVSVELALREREVLCRVPSDDDKTLFSVDVS